MAIISSERLTVKYGKKLALKQVDIEVRQGQILSIIGPNGSGKSTFVKALSRSLKASSGKIYFQGQDLRDLKNKVIARDLAILPQIKKCPKDLTVRNLVSFGRYPHLGLTKKLSSKDQEIVDWALQVTDLKDYEKRLLYSLSGGERQRAWIAMALAQEPKTLILDEPTTYLDISYQIEILELIDNLNKELGLTVIMVLHDLNQAARYSDYVYVLKDGQVCHKGRAETIVEEEILKNIFRIEAHTYQDQINDCPYFIAHKII